MINIQTYDNAELKNNQLNLNAFVKGEVDAIVVKNILPENQLKNCVSIFIINSKLLRIAGHFLVLMMM